MPLWAHSRALVAIAPRRAQTNPARRLPKALLAGGVEHAVRIGGAKPWADENRAHIGREQLGRKTARYSAPVAHRAARLPTAAALGGYLPR